MRFNLCWDHDGYDLWSVRVVFAAWSAAAVGAFLWAIVGGDFAVLLGLAFSLGLVALGVPCQESETLSGPKRFGVSRASKSR